MLCCEICGDAYDRPEKSKRRTCSRSCAVSLSWKNDASRSDRCAAIKEAVNKPDNVRRIVNLNHKRWTDESERERLAALSRERWADPAYKEKTSAAIREVWTPEKREEYSNRVRCAAAQR